MSKIKRVLAITISSILLCTGICPMHAADAEPTIVLGHAPALPGESVTVTVDFQNNPGIVCFTLSFDYDTSALTLTEVSLADGISGQFNYAKRAVWIAFSDTDYSGTWLTLTFTVAEGAVGYYPISVNYASGDICNYDEEEISFAISPGVLTVNDGTIDILWGDVDGNSDINATDSMYLTRYTGNWDASTYTDATNLLDAITSLE